MCVITGTGGIRCWELIESGQVGDGTIENSYQPADVIGLPGE